MDIERLTEDDVLVVRRRMAQLAIATQDAFGATEPTNPVVFASAVFRQYTGAGGVFKYTTIPAIAANLFYGVAKGHSFENGNKRTALLAMLALIERNRCFLVNTTEDELYEMARNVAADERRDADLATQELAIWLSPRIRRKVLGDTNMAYRDLKEVLEKAGCQFESPSQNYVKIKNRNWVVKTGYPRASFDVPVKEVKRIRRALRLNEAQGVDSAALYDLESTVDKFVNEYRDLMRRLADL